MKAPRKRDARTAPPAPQADEHKPAQAAPSTEGGEESGLPDEVFEFVAAMDEYKRRERRPFPSWSEVLGVLKSLGYTKAKRSA